MHRIFVSYKFLDPYRTYAQHVKELIKSHSLEPVDGEDLGGGPLSPSVMKRIEDCDGLVALLLDPDREWVQDELSHACSKEKRVFVIVASELLPTWKNTRNLEYRSLELNSPLPAFIKLSTTIGLWRREAGRKVAVRVLPENIAKLTSKENSLYSCRYRLFRESEAASTWQTVRPAPLDSGYVFMANGVTDDLRIQVEVAGTGVPCYSSVAMPQLVSVDLKEDNT